MELNESFPAASHSVDDRVEMQVLPLAPCRRRAPGDAQGTYATKALGGSPTAATMLDGMR